MKHYFLTRFSDLHKWVVSKSRAAKHDGGQNIGPINDYQKALKERNELNRKIKKNEVMNIQQLIIENQSKEQKNGRVFSDDRLTDEENNEMILAAIEQIKEDVEL